MKKTLSRHFRLSKEVKRFLNQSSMSRAERRHFIEQEYEYQEKRKSRSFKREPEE